MLKYYKHYKRFSRRRINPGVAIVPVTFQYPARQSINIQSNFVFTPSWLLTQDHNVGAQSRFFLNFCPQLAETCT